MSDLDSNGSNFKNLLDQQYQFPCYYTFKFVVPNGQKAILVGSLGEGIMVKERSSKGGKYVGLTFSQIVSSSDEVIAIYHKATSVKGVICL